MATSLAVMALTREAGPWGRPSPRRSALLGALLLLASLLGAFALYTRHAGMPFYYHSDEPSKVEQVTGVRSLNFKHPLLLMNVTRALARATGADREAQAAVRVGRAVSAAFAAACVALLTALAWLEGGLLAALCVAPLVLLGHALFTYAHFMKEDTALACGFAAVLLATSAFARRASAATAAALGAACALAVSAKYIGVVALVGALPLIVLRGRERPELGAARALGAFASGLAAVLAVVNSSVLLDFPAFRAGLAYETDHVATGGGRPFAGSLSIAYWHGLNTQTTWPVRLLSAGFIGYVLATWRRRSFGERAITLFPVLYLALLQISPIKAIRYLLPTVVALHTLAGFAIATLATRLGRGSAPRRAVFAMALLGVAVAAGGRQIALHLHEFAGESRSALYAWVRDDVPPESGILQDRYAGLPDPSEGSWTPSQPYLKQVVVTRHYAADYGNYDELVARGIEYVAVCERITQRFFETDRRFGSEEARRRFERRRAFYGELFARGELVFEAGTSRVAGAPVNPIVRVYRIGEASRRSD